MRNEETRIFNTTVDLKFSEEETKKSLPKDDSLRKKMKAKNYYASSAVLSLYFPLNQRGKFDSNHVVSDDEFLKNTYLSVDFRSQNK